MNGFDAGTSPEVTRNLLLLVQDEIGWMPTLTTVRSWPTVTREDVTRWAAAVHLYASDNDDVVIPPMPGVLGVQRQVVDLGLTIAPDPDPDPLWMRVVARLSTVDWWAIGAAAVVGAVGGVLVGLWYR